MDLTFEDPLPQSLDMSSETLTDLAPELIIQILKSSDSFADVTSLSGTCRKMFIIWKTNVDTISEAILARTVPCYAEALELIDAQETAEGDEHSVFGYQSAVDRAKWMLKDADTAARALVYFEKFFRKELPSIQLVSIPSIRPRRLTLAERTDFTRAFYRATTLATLGAEPLPGQLFPSWSMLELEQVTAVTDWLLDFCSRSHLLDLRIECGCDCSPHTPAGFTCLRKWIRLSSALGQLRSDLCELATMVLRVTYTTTILLPFMVRYRYPEGYKSDKDIRIADLLALGPEKGSRYDLGHMLSYA